LKVFLSIEKYLAAGLLKLLDFSWRKKVINDTYSQPCIYVFWHRNQIPLTVLNAKKRAGVLISSSKDGELIAGPLDVLGYKPIRGSSTRGGGKAFMQMLRFLEQAPVAITPDGPKGPLYKVKSGALQLAKLSQKPIIPIAVDVKGEWLFNSWDKFRIPKPFARINITFGPLFPVEKDDDLESKRILLEELLAKITEENKISWQ
jgi:lysophospholipid acyltransferase (LPLAT)-like uncharacterized protein